MNKLFTNIPNSHKWTRLSLESEKAFYSAMKELNGKDILVQKLMEEGRCNEGKNTYRLFGWIEGIEATKGFQIGTSENNKNTL